MPRSHDLVLFGATGFTGGLTAEYLARHAPASARWALAGRNLVKLDAVRTRLAAINPACAKLPLIEADSGDTASLLSLAESTKAVITTVGPYVHFGEPLVAACAAAGTQYADLTGEPEFVDRMWLKHHETAKQTGARLVHCCGFDSIPHDLGVYYTVLQLPDDVPIRINAYVSLDAEFSAGTYHSAINAFGRAGQYAGVAMERRRREAPLIDRRIGSSPQRLRRHPELGTWVVPFPTIDPQVVKRSATMLERYGPDFRYGHFLQMDKFSQVAKLIGGVGAVAIASQLKPARNWLLGRKDSGEGPSEAKRSASWFRVRFHAVAGDRRLITEVRGGDPGYDETARMLGESGLSLAFDRLPKRAGQLTPAAAMGDALLKRLQRSGLIFRTVEPA
ncbi:trans-acting enoyl reductase family protein [uncultured Nevskia sp.]|uniref:saccharopine dehydrogenase family protein n=1 Tax=uncultured Nevskia sp. TaxID=228950 RepID=UPI0025DCE14C|nr:saccharopine dehydrogenase NADP-binding domain-containing protein [uncultured Nevskia sp.]